MGQALYRKYRSRSFDDVVGQEHIIKTLKNAINSGRVSHAYLFTGPRGVGKTSIARILAHEINNLEYSDESMHLDIIEIDAASNRRIDEIRELRDKVHIAPTSAKYKVYIIDEVHMLTREAFNALLKTLEEPPAHCIFILATTEVHKLPETIISRTQHFSFKPIDNNEVVEHLKNLAKSEGIDIDNGALKLLAEHGGGSMRDSVSLLDQLGGKQQKVGVAEVQEIIGLPPETLVSSLVKNIEAGDSRLIMADVDKLKERGVSAALLAKALNTNLREKLLNGSSSPWLISLLRQLSRVAASANPQEELEIDILEAASHNFKQQIPADITPQPSQIPSPPSVDEPQEEIIAEAEIVPEVIVEEIIDEPMVVEKPSTTGSFSLESWPEIVTKTRTEAASIYTALRLAKPSLSDGKLVLAFQFPLHQKKLIQAKNMDLLSRIIEGVSGAKVNIEAVVDKTVDKTPSTSTVTPKASAPAAVTPDLQAISNIFGTAEMLES